MKSIQPPNRNELRKLTGLSLALLATTGLALAQDQTPHGWRSVNDPPPIGDQGPESQPEPPNFDAQPDLDQVNPAQSPDWAQANQGNYPLPTYPRNNHPAALNLPAQLTIKPGTFVTVRVNQWLSSDRNQAGDTFAAILEQPIVVDGLVVAQRGQTVFGRVTEAQKAGRVEGTSRLGVELTDLTFVDGQQASVHSQMINRTGPTSTGRDAAAIGETTALGAIIGASADWGRGAAIGAGAGAAAGIIGVLLTRGRPTVIYPESVLTFRLEQPVTIATGHAPQAFRYADNRDYGRSPAMTSRQPYGVYAPGYPPAYPAPGPYAYGYPYPYYGGGFGLYIGPRYGYYGRGFYGGGYRRH
ncbi:MAG: hypothetical protein M3N93_08890 [Acidobacteriota bacterium]|nr:hypothetical protein [Acidobacteriota bacterium]